MKLCSVELCGRKHYGLGLCRLHYCRATAPEPVKPPHATVCSVEGCSAPFYAKGFCGKHYQQKRLPRKPAKTCTNCGAGVSSRRKSLLCLTCYQKDYSKKLRNKQPTYWTERECLKKYGMTLAQREALLELQERKCAGCGIGPLAFTGTDGPAELRAAVDHCHQTGKVRAVLCNWCNVGLGYYEKVAPWAQDYLNRFRSNDG